MKRLKIFKLSKSCYHVQTLMKNCELMKEQVMEKLLKQFAVENP